MTHIRHLMGLRMKAAAAAVVLTYALLFQLVLGAVAQGAMAVPLQADGFAVLCSSHGAVALPQQGGDGPQGGSVDCPCATLCRLGAAAAPAVLVSVAHLRSSEVTQVLVPPGPRDSAARPQCHFFPHQARAPPAVSV